MQLLYVALIWLTAIGEPPSAAKRERIRFRR
jgi:hypothetical protein